MDDAEWQPKRWCVIGGRVRCGAVVLFDGRTLVCHRDPDHGDDMHREAGIFWP